MLVNTEGHTSKGTDRVYDLTRLEQDSRKYCCLAAIELKDVLFNHRSSKGSTSILLMLSWDFLNY